jgi:hypothetical protein
VWRSGNVSLDGDVRGKGSREAWQGMRTVFGRAMEVVVMMMKRSMISAEVVEGKATLDAMKWL